MEKKFSDIVEICNIYFLHSCRELKSRTSLLEKTNLKLKTIDERQEEVFEKFDKIPRQQLSGATGTWQRWLSIQKNKLLQEKALRKALEVESFENTKKAFSQLYAAKSVEEKHRREQSFNQDIKDTSALQSLMMIRQHTHF